MGRGIAEKLALEDAFVVVTGRTVEKVHNGHFLGRATWTAETRISTRKLPGEPENSRTLLTLASHSRPIWTAVPREQDN